MKSLNRVQKAAKIIRILLKIGYIASIAGAACCVIGAILCGVLSGNEAFREALASAEKTGSFMEKREMCYTFPSLHFIFCRKEVISWPEVPDLRADFKTV